MPRIKNHAARDAWIENALRALPAGSSLLDVGAGECAYKPHCAHLEYLAQDIAEYDGTGDGAGLHTGQWDTSRLDFVCDLYDIPVSRVQSHFEVSLGLVVFPEFTDRADPVWWFAYPPSSMRWDPGLRYMSLLRRYLLSRPAAVHR